jgi:hypothetical protein
MRRRTLRTLSGPQLFEVICLVLSDFFEFYFPQALKKGGEILTGVGKLVDKATTKKTPLKKAEAVEKESKDAIRLAEHPKVFKEIFPDR